MSIFLAFWKGVFFVFGMGVYYLGAAVLIPFRGLANYPIRFDEQELADYRKAVSARYRVGKVKIDGIALTMAAHAVSERRAIADPDEVVDSLALALAAVEAYLKYAPRDPQ